MLRTIWILCLLAIPGFLLSQNVTGIVTDASTSEPLIGANVLVKGSSTGTSTDLDGSYSIAASPGDTLAFSYTGYETSEYAVTSANMSLNVQLRTANFELTELVVIGYGTTTVKDNTGSVAALSEKDFNPGNIVTPENLLNGRVAGVTISTGGAPGSGSAIRIRGGSSLSASNDPLIVINGLPISNNTIGGGRSILSTINPADIESFTVLKDASATAIYGSRASNGVIIITTKDGGSELNIDFSTQIGINTLPENNLLDVYSAEEFRTLVRERRPDLADQLGDANTDWQQEIYRNTTFQNYNLAIQGSLFKTIPARLSLGLTDQPGIRLTSEFERRSASLNLNPSFLDDNLKITVNANASQEQNRFASGQEGNAITWDPTQPVYDPSSPFGGFFEYYQDNGDGVLNASDLIGNAPGNPVAALLQRNDRSTVNRYYGNAKIDYTLPFLPELTASINVGLDDASSEGRIIVDDDSRATQPNGEFLGSESTYTNDQRNVLFDGYLAYKKQLNEKFRFDATAGYSYQRFENESFSSGELRNDLPDTEPIFSQATDLVLVGFFGRANFSLSDKYLLTLSMRQDATSRFSEDNRWGTFPAAAFAWRVREDFFPQSDVLTNLKLRLGWGVTGQQDIGAGDIYLARYNRGQPSSQYAFGNEVIPIGVPQFRNEELKWEETTTWNVGLDYGLWGSRLNGTVEYFYKESDDLLAFAAISDGSNFSNSGFQNIGNFTSQGVEFSVNYDIFERRNGPLGWNVNFNATVIKTKIEELALGQDVRTGGIGGGVGNTIQVHRVGFAPFKYFVYKQVYDEDNNPIEGAYVDLNGDNIINDDDRYLYRNNQPELTLGFLTNFSYNNFDLSMNFRASIGNYIYNNVLSARAQFDLIQNINVLSNLPTAVEESNFNTTATVLLSDYWMENGSFLRLDNVTVGYTFPSAFNTGADLRITAGVQNAFVITNYSGLDPEIFSGIDNTIYPRARTFLFGANVNF